MAELSVTVVGAGDTARAHLFTWSQLSGVHAASVVDSDGHAVARVSADFGVPAFTSLQHALDAEGSDIVDICVADAMESARIAIRHGANVLCPAPPAGSAGEIAVLSELAVSRERLVMPTFLFRFHPLTLFIRDMIEGDDLGTPTMLRCRLAGGLAQQEEEDALHHHMLHCIDLFRFLCGEVKDATGISSGEPGTGSGTPATRAAAVVRGEIAFGTLEGSSVLVGARSALEVYGTAGACVAEFETGSLRYRTADQPVWQSREESGAGALERLLTHFTDVLRGLQTPLCSINDAQRAASLCNSLRKA